MRRRLLGLAMAGLLVAACGGGSVGGEPAPVTTHTTPFSQIRAITPNAGDLHVIVLPDANGDLPPDTVIGCMSDLSFPYSALVDNHPFLADRDMPEVEEAIRPFLESQKAADYFPQDGWRVLDQTADRVILAYSAGSVSEVTVAFMTVEKRDGTWVWAGASSGDGCPLATTIPKTLSTVDWRLDPSAAPLTAESTTIRVLATELACTGGKAMGDRLLGPEVVVTETEVRTAFAAQPLDGEAHECPGNPDQPVAIELSGPIGDRQLVDGLALGVSLEDILQSKDR